jgi:hypothetical protein
LTSTRAFWPAPKDCTLVRICAGSALFVVWATAGWTPQVRDTRIAQSITAKIFANKSNSFGQIKNRFVVGNLYSNRDFSEFRENRAGNHLPRPLLREGGQSYSFY